MSYFNEITDYATYSGHEADFHFTYNANSGGGQAFLGGRFYDENGQLTSPETLNGKIAAFKYIFRSGSGEELSVIINDDKAKYEIKSRGNGSTSMKLSIGTDHIAPSKVVSSFMMLPPTCGVKTPSSLQLSILSANNYWLQSMWLEYSTSIGAENEVIFTIKDCVFGGGVSKETTDRVGRYFKFDFEKRMADIITLSNDTDTFNEEITRVIKLFSDIYLGLHAYNYEECTEATKSLMEVLSQQFPEVYSGITDPVSALLDIAMRKRREDEVMAGAHEESSVGQIRPIRFDTGLTNAYHRNRIIFGAPGTGKSYTLNREKDVLLADGGEYERVTFHPDYSYANFVGTYKPVPCRDSDGKEAITYSYVPGPFIRTYVKALQNGRTDSPKPFLLVIEEINRANVAAVFGDVFQLLDRGDDEVSEYPIQASEDIKKYLAEKLGGNPDNYSEIRIPDNMFIWATMNSADQGVFPMDTAFKRRWDFTYLGIDDSEAGIIGKKVILGQGDYRRVVEWNALRRAINNELLTYKVNEDKLMGPYFISKKNLPEGEIIDPAVFTRIFKNKIIMYLFDDAAKQKRITLFSGCDEKAKNQYSKICSEFDTKGVYIFCEGISSQFLDRVPEDAYIANSNAPDDLDCFSMFGTNSFNLVWEKVCAEVMDNQLQRPIGGLRLPVPLAEPYRGMRHKKLIDLIDRPQWAGTAPNGESYTKQAEDTLIPDLISIINVGGDCQFIIFDAKYYNLQLEHNKKLRGQPGIESITKQYLYQLAYQPFVEAHQIGTVRNCFLMPTASKEIISKGTAALAILSELGLQDIQVRLLPAEMMYHHYLNDIKMDIRMLNL